jgi:RNA 2',3'-cyclic 3'-phosphodiesterase
MRLFAAVPVPEPARGEVARVLERLRGGDLPVRWVAGDGFHLTLKFYGEVGADRLDAIAEAVRETGRAVEPLPLRLTDLGAFPSPSRARVLWMGVEAPPALELLQDGLERRSEAIGFEPEGVPFRPHVTLGRVREGHRCRLAEVEAAAGAYDQVPFLGTDLVLYESVAGAGRPRYVALVTVELGG